MSVSLTALLENKKVKNSLKKLQEHKKLVFLIILLLIAIASINLFYSVSKVDKVKHEPTSVGNVNDLKNLNKEDVTLWINQAGPYDRDFYFRKNDKIKISLDITKNTQESLVPLANELIMKHMIGVQIEGANEIEEFNMALGMHGGVEYGDPKNVTHGQHVNLDTSYIAKKAGRDTIRVSIKGTNIQFESHVFIQDPSYFTIPIDLNAEDITFTTGPSISVESNIKHTPGKINNSEAWWDIDYPGGIEFKFTSKGKKFDNAYLAIYEIAAGALQKYDENNPLDNYPYLKNLKALTKVVAEKPRLPQESNEVISFPPVNAAPGPRSNIGFVDFQNGTGIRYVIAGWYQSYEASDFPTYTYQGITSDGKYHVFFRYSKLYSPQLDNYLLNHKNNYDSNITEQLDRYISGSFATIETEENFSPSLDELDTFVKSIKIGK